MDFKWFYEAIKSGIESGAIKTDKPLTEFEMAVQFAVCSIGVRKGYPCETTLEEIRSEIEQFAPELLEEGEEDATH